MLPMRALCAPFQRAREKRVLVDVRSADLARYAANAMLATRISFMNAMALLAETLGDGIEPVHRGIGSDPRICHHFLCAGCGYGGSIFRKGVNALRHRAAALDEPRHLLQAVGRANERQKLVLVDRVVAHLGSDPTGRRFALWGLALAGLARLDLAAQPRDAAAGAGALIVVTECKTNRAPDLDRLRRLLRQSVVIDGRLTQTPPIRESP